MVVINQKHLRLTEGLSKESNKLARSFNNKNYSKIENIDNLLLKRDISIEKKKRILIKKVHNTIPVRVEYSLTTRGKEFINAFKPIEKWSKKWNVIE